MAKSVPDRRKDSERSAVRRQASSHLRRGARREIRRCVADLVEPVEGQGDLFDLLADSATAVEDGAA
jgi:hypothetical protein